MSDSIDDRIREALEVEDSGLIGGLDREPSRLEQLFAIFGGAQRWAMRLTMVAMTSLLLLALFCGWRFFQASFGDDRPVWAMGFAFCVLAIVGMKVWFWLERSKNAILRQLKHLELQISHLADRLPEV